MAHPVTYRVLRQLSGRDDEPWLERARQDIARARREIRQGRFQRSMAVVTGVSAIVSGFETYVQHRRGAFSHWLMWTPVWLTPPVALAAAAAVVSERAARRLLPAISIVSLADGIIGFGYHIRGIRNLPGGFRLGRYNIVMGPPVFAPLLTCTGRRTRGASRSAVKTSLWPSLSIWKGRSRPRRARYAAKSGLNVAAPVVPRRSISAKLVRSIKEKLSSGNLASISEAASRSARTTGSTRTPLSRRRSQKVSATSFPNLALSSCQVSVSNRSVVRCWSMLWRIDLARPSEHPAWRRRQTRPSCQRTH